MKPQDLFLDIRDILSVFVPGSVLLFAVSLYVPDHGIKFDGIVPGTQAITFAALAYGIGSFFFAAGALFDHIYDRWEHLLAFGSRRDRLVQLEEFATKARCSIIREQSGDDDVLLTLWSNKSFWVGHLRQICPAGSAELDRIEAAQKFFRTFAAVLVAVILFSTWQALAPRQMLPVPSRGSEVMAAIGAFAILVACIGFYAFRRAEWTYRLVKWVYLANLQTRRSQ